MLNFLSLVFNTSLTWKLRVTVEKTEIDTESILKTVHDSIYATFLSEYGNISLRKSLGEFSKENFDTLPKLQDNPAEII